jgi:acyl carrier protein
LELTAVDNFSAGQVNIRQRVLAVLENVLGYSLDPDTKRLDDLDSLQVLELLVSLEEEFDIDSDKIIEAHPDWWTSLDDLVAALTSLIGEGSAETTTRR